MIDLLNTDATRRFPYLPAAAVCLGIGALTLLVLPGDVGYDPWSWLNWGRELDHLGLTMTGSSSAFKPLAVFIDAFLAPAGHSAPALWTVVVRGATMLAMALAFDCGRRLQGVPAGVIAALALLTIQNVSTYLALQGMAEPLEMCCCLAALECSLAARPRAATAWLVAASLLELELTGAMLLYGLIFVVWPAPRRGRAAACLVLLVVLIGLAWILPDLIAGGGALRHQASLAARPTAGGPLLKRVPALATIVEVRTMLLWPLALGWAAELVVGVVWLLRRRSLRPLFAPALIAALFVLGVAVATQLHRTTGTSRFLVAAAAIGVVAAACLWVEGAHAAAARLAAYASARLGGYRRASALIRAAPLAGGLIVWLVVVVLLKGGLIAWQASVRRASHESRQVAAAEKHLPRAIAAAGGAEALLACGAVYTGSDDVPMVAWALGVPPSQISGRPATTPTGSVVSLRWNAVTIEQPARYRPLPTGQQAGSAWLIYSTCVD